MIYLLLDTNIYLDMRFKRHSSVPAELEGRLDSFLSERLDDIRLIVPRCVEGEYKRGIRKIYEQSLHTVSTIAKAIENWQYPVSMHELDEISQLPKLQQIFTRMKRQVKEKQAAETDIDWLERLFAADYSIVVPTSSEVLFAAVQREVDHQMPFSNGGGLTDAILVEIATNPRKYLERFNASEDEIWLVSRDRDFRQGEELHPELVAEAERNGVRLKLKPMFIQTLKTLGFDTTPEELESEERLASKSSERDLTLGDILDFGQTFAIAANEYRKTLSQLGQIFALYSKQGMLPMIEAIDSYLIGPSMHRQVEDKEDDDTSSETKADTSPEINPDDDQAEQPDNDSPDIDEPDSNSETDQN